MGIAYRWFDFLVLTGIAFVVSQAAAPYTAEWRHTVALINTPLGLPYFLLAVILLAFLAAVSISTVSRPCLRHLAVIHRYPPTWLAPSIGAAITLLCQAYVVENPTFDTVDWCLSIGAVNALLLLSEFYLELPRNRCSGSSTKPPSKLQNPVNSQPCNEETIDHWIMHDNPIVAESQDRFDFKAMANRIASLLSQSTSRIDTAPIGIIGPMGSGKSSLVNLVEEQLRNRKSRVPFEVVLVRVSCWGFDSAHATLLRIIEAVIIELTKRVDCLALRSLPERYRRSLSAGGSWSHALAESFSTESDPTQLLHRLTPHLSAAQVRIVLVLEDIDRNAVGFDHPSIFAALNRIRDVQGLSYILSSQSTQSGKIDFQKLCNHIERMPQISTQFLRDQIEVYASRALHGVRMYPNLKSLKKYELARGESRSDRRAWQLGPANDLVHHLAKILRTPRSLKHVLRATDAAWSKLSGEIDFDDLFVAKALRFGADGVYNFLLDNMDALRSATVASSFPSQHQRNVKQRKKKLRREWRVHTHEAEYDVRAARALVAFLVPECATMLSVSKFWRESTKLQGVGVSSPTDYWSRLNAGDPSDASISDQEILKAMNDWPDRNSNDLPRILAASEFAGEKWEHFSSLMTQDQYLPLTGGVIDEVLKNNNSELSGEHAALLALWRKIHHSSLPRDKCSADWLSGQITKVLPRSIQMANDLYYYWASKAYGVVDDEGRADARNSMCDAARFHFENDPIALVNALPKTSTKAFALNHLCFPVDHNELKSEKSDPRDWTWLAQSIVSALRSEPKAVILQVFMLVTKSTFRHSVEQGHITNYDIDEEKVGQIFRHLSPDVMQFLETYRDEIELRIREL